eukprot:3486348-Pleurochrysis_carterae.AAC.1
MGIMAFGCKAFAVKPKSAISKTRMDERAWVGINLGRNHQSPGAFNVYVPGLRVVVTSDVYFDEANFPWSPTAAAGISAAGIPPQPALPSVPPGLAEATEQPAPPHDVRSADHVIGAASRSRRVLLLFSGPFQRPGGIAAFLTQSERKCDTLDNHRAYGGGEAHNLLHDSVYQRLLQ